MTGAEQIQSFSVGGGQDGTVDEVGPVAQGFFEGRAASPLPNAGVVAVGQNFGDECAAKVGGAGVLGVVEEAAGAVGGVGEGSGECRAGVGCSEAFMAGRVRVAEDAGEETDDGIDDYGRGEFTAGEDVVADG